VDLTRRSLFRAVAAAATLQEAAVADGIQIHVGQGAGPAPMGAPAETSIPFARGRLRDAGGFAVFSPSGKPVLAQMRAVLRWPDSSVRWLALAFEPEAGPATYTLRKGEGPKGADLEPPSLPLDLVITRHDGKIFRSSAAGASRRLTTEDLGAVRVCLRETGQCRAADGEPLFDFLIRRASYRGRPDTLLSVTWINTTNRPSERIRDIRLVLPFDFAPNRLVFGCENGVYDGPFLKDWPVSLLQEDHDCYWARTRNPDGRLQHLSTGGANGERCPGWLYVGSASRTLGVWLKEFWQEYPNEIRVTAGEVSLGLWPADAAPHLASKPQLSSNPDGETPYVKTKYWPVLPHPYLAFFDAAAQCLDARQGLAKTQTLVLSTSSSFEKKWWGRALAPVRGHLDPAYCSGTRAAGLIEPGGRFERLFAECFGWFDRHIDRLQCYGKFDYGDFRYMTAAPDYMTHPGTKWGAMGEMPREGYWHNNEGDPLLGLLLYYMRTGEMKAWERCCIVARHLLDVDIRHHPFWGMYTHGYGHCYVETAPAGAPDHSWLLGLLLWSGLSADPVAWDWLLRCGEHLLEYRPDFTQVDTRTVSVHLHMMCKFHDYTGRQEFLAAARLPAGALLRVQSKDGSWPAYMEAPDRVRAPGFVDHAIAALADYFAMGGDVRVRQALDAALDWQFASGDLSVPLVAYGLAVLHEKTADRRYAERVRQILEHLEKTQNRTSDPIGRGDIGWAGWGVHNPEAGKAAGRPPQFLNQSRPLMPGFTLAYAQPAAAIIDKGSVK
jgi:hypothetical protein